MAYQGEYFVERYGHGAAEATATHTQMLMMRSLERQLKLRRWADALNLLLPDLLRDLKQLGVNTTGLEGSSETFLRMWERAQSSRSGMADAAADISL